MRPGRVDTSVELVLAHRIQWGLGRISAQSHGRAISMLADANGCCHGTELTTQVDIMENLLERLYILFLICTLILFSRIWKT